jgi:hypothetical protein
MFLRQESDHGPLMVHILERENPNSLISAMK